ncbi:odorant receptor 131-2-like [Rhinophrynus dorsalis]
MAVIMSIYFTTPHVRETTRYTLFAHMLINDTLQLCVTMFLFIAVTYSVYMPVPVCFAVVTFSTSSFLVTPYNLATMSLERYIAICHPLRHVQLCTGKRCNVAISVMWTMGVTPIIAEFCAISYSVDKKFLSQNLICVWRTLVVNQTQSSIRSLSLIISFIMVGLIILYTYVKVMMVARKIGSGKSSAFKAGKTVILHAFQLLLCMTSFTSTFTENYFNDYFDYLAVISIINFFFFICLPRYISPLIYGLRDEVFRKCIKKLFSNIF